jgi:hypothetical protein
MKNRLDQKEFNRAEQLISAIESHFGLKVSVEMERLTRGTAWLLGTTGKRIVGFIFFQSDDNLWRIGGSSWITDFECE